MKRITKPKIWDFFILAARFLIGWTFLRYGLGKLTGGQFGLTDLELQTPIQNLSPFRISWYLFDLQPFKAITGILQVICGLLLIYNRTLIIGAFLFLPLAFTILLMDITFMPTQMAHAFAWRMSYYIGLDLAILWHYKEKIKTIWDSVWHGVNTKFKYKLWVYLILPVVALFLEFFSPRFLFQFVTHPVETVKNLCELFAQLIETFLNK